MSIIYLSESANPMLKAYLMRLGHEISEVRASTHVYASIASHPDIYMCKLGTGRSDTVMRFPPETLSQHYPGNIRYNAVFMGKYFIHNLAFTADELIKAAEHMGKISISVKQGYTKCNMAVVSENAAITSDRGIAKALSKTDIDLLLISHGHVALAGHRYGFLGGSSGKVGDEMIFHGNLAAHPDFFRIVEFLKRHKCKLTYFEEFELEDIGSIIEALS